MNFYTNVQSFGNHILYRGIDNGKRVKKKLDYSPSLFIPSKKVTNFTNLEGDYLDQKIFGTIREAKDYIKKFQEIVNATKIYGQTRFEYAFVAEQHKGMVDYDFNKLLVAFIDIEVGSENGFPDPYQANEPITAITIRYLNGHTYVYGCGDFENNNPENVSYHKCKDEYSLCKSFLATWTNKTPDIVTGWNTKFFDIPYIVNRFRKLFGEDETKKLSPWNYIGERTVVINGRPMTSYDMLGVASLDYIELYKWYAPGGKSQESYRLDNIAHVELGKKKIDYSEYENLHQLYRLNYQKFIEYNIVDVELVIELEDKLKLLELAVTLAYDTKTNFEDVFAQTRMWDSLTYSYLYEKGVIVPPKVIQNKNSAFEGAYVKEPQIGMHEWVASFDLNSLYPHLMMQYNISPETLIDPQNYTQEMNDIIAQGITVDKLLNCQIDTSKLKGATLTPNGQFFRTDFQGFLPKMMEEMYVDRKKFKKLMLQAQQEYQNENDPAKKRELENKIAKYNNIQLAKKVSLNSAYGALGSQYFRFYDLRMALAVTLAGQLSIRWIENKLNNYLNELLKTNKDYVIASDTDSIYLNLSSLVDTVFETGSETAKVIAFMDKVCENKIQPYIDKSYEELANYVHAYQQKMEMKREALSNRGIWTAKKRYVLNVYNNEGVQYKQPKMKIMGLEVVKSSTPSIIREKMKDTIELIMNGSETEVQEHIANFREQFKSLPAEEISFPRSINGLNKYFDKATLYKLGTPIHVKGAILYNHYLQEYDLIKKYPTIKEGEKIKFTYLKTPNHFKNTVVSYPSRLPPEFNLQEFIDYETQFEKAFIEPIRIILDCIGWKIEKISSLEDFFA